MTQLVQDAIVATGHQIDYNTDLSLSVPNPVSSTISTYNARFSASKPDQAKQLAHKYTPTTLVNVIERKE